MSKVANNTNTHVIEAKFIWMDKNGKIHYVSKEKFDSMISMAEKVVDGGIKMVIFTGISAVGGGQIFAASGNPIMDGLQPVIKLIGNFAEPVAYGYMVKGFLNITQGKEEEGMKVIKNSIKGYLGAKFVPQIMGFISDLNLFV